MSHRVVVIGGGFGGLAAVRRLKRAGTEIVLIDRRNFHLFQPLLYQVATGSLTAGEIASPLRGLLKRRRDVTVMLGSVTSLDLEARAVVIDPVGDRDAVTVPYDTLIAAAGAGHAYFGHDEWEPLAPGLKTVEDAIEIRRRILTAFEAAEADDDPERRAAWLTFVIVGAGPTGVELAGQIGEIARDTLRRDFRSIDPASARILLLEGDDRVLTAFDPRLSARAERALGQLGVSVQVGALVSGVDARGVTVTRGDGGTDRIAARTVVWAAGVQASGLARLLAAANGAETDRAGRVTVGPDLALPGHPEVMALGDMVRVADGAGGVLPLPGVAPVAMQQGRYAADAVRRRLAGRGPGPPFRYRDKGNLATIGRLRAVGEIKGLRLSGFPAWAGWLLVHLFYLSGLQNRVLVMIRWTVSFVTHGRGARLITPAEDPPTGRGGSPGAG
ncbi:MAG TPA: NAD(P)/FAD-dependent oxidoreductase [Miltoncostaeaceae bacterium]|nr:NAD(P)/FAD-dependent oxidoreductase [Miltoncostaeaceae bacterium]